MAKGRVQAQFLLRLSVINRIQKAARFSGNLNRLEFFIVVVTIYLVVHIALQALSASGFAASSSVGESIRNSTVVWVVFATLCLPFAAARLRSLGWPTYLSAILFLPLIPRAFFMFHWATDGVYANHQVAFYLVAISRLWLGALGFILVLLVWPSRRADDAG